MQTDLSLIDDAKELKSMAYDQIANKEEAERNLAKINQRLIEVMAPKPDEAEPKPPSGVSDEHLGIETPADKVE